MNKNTNYFVTGLVFRNGSSFYKDFAERKKAEQFASDFNRMNLIDCTQIYVQELTNQEKVVQLKMFRQ